MSVVGFSVRVGSAADLEAVVTLERAVVEAPHWGEAEYAAMVAQQGGGVRRRLFIAELEDRLVGFSVGKVIGAAPECVGELESVVVDGGARRCGVGMALCEAMVKWCRSEGAAEMELEVRAGSAGAIALYDGLGFVAVGRRRGYYPGVYGPGHGLGRALGQAEDALLMRLELAGGE
jgi:[ribosomal protein S18]-alanine N-acetyltransferase